MCAHTYLYCATMKNCVPKLQHQHFIALSSPRDVSCSLEADFGNYCKAIAEKFVPQKERTWLATLF